MSLWVFDRLRSRLSWSRLLGLFCLPLSGLQAQPHAQHLSEADFLTSIPVAQAASGIRQSLHQTPASVSVIDRATIEASGATNLPDLMRLVPGFQVFHVNSNKFGVNYHGVTDEFPNQLEVRIDGRSVYLPLLSTVDWTSLALHPNDLERIEIVRGSNSATQGSNAFLGSINFITRHPSLTPKWAAEVQYGSRDRKHSHLQHSSALGDGFYRLSLNHEQNAGSSQFKDAAERLYLNGAYAWTPDLQNNLTLRFGLDQGHTRIGYLFPNSGFPDKERYISKRDYQANFQQLDWSKELNSGMLRHLRVSRSDLQLDEMPPSTEDLVAFYRDIPNFGIATLFQQLNPSFVGYREKGKVQTKDLELAFESDKHQKVTHYSGFGYRVESAESPVLLQSGLIAQERFRVFSSLGIPLNDQLLLNLGGMYERQASLGSGQSLRSALNWQMAPNQSLRLGYSHSERLPSLLERHGNYQILIPYPQPIDQANPNLEPELNQSWELGWLYEFTALQASLDLRVFDEQVSRVLVNTQQTNGAGTKDNLGGWHNRGLEAQLRFQPTTDFWLLANAAYIHNQTHQWSQGVFDNFVGGQLLPRTTLSILLNWQVQPDWTVNLTHYFMDNATWRKSYGVLEPRQSAYHRTDLGLKYQWSTTAGQEFELAGRVENLWDRDYQEFYPENRQERRFLVRLSMSID